MKRKRKVILKILLALFIFLSAINLYLLIYVYLPLKIKSQLVSQLSSQFGIKLNLDKVYFSLQRGFVFENLIIFNQQDNQPLFKIGNISAQILFLPFLKKQLIIPSLSINNAYLLLERDVEGNFNILKFFSGKQKSNATFNLIIHHINIKNFQIDYRDNWLEPSFTALADINAAHFRIFPLETTFSINGFLKKEQDTIQINCLGKYILKSNKLKAILEIPKLNLSPYLSYLEIPFQSDTLPLTNIKSEFSYFNNSLDISLKATAENSNLIFEKLAANNATADIDLSIKLDLTNQENLSYYLVLSNIHANLKNNLKFPDAHLKNGQIKITPNLISLDKVVLEALDSSIILNGSLAYLDKTLKYNLNFNCPSVAVPKLQDLLKKSFNLNLSRIRTQGNAELNLDISNLEEDHRPYFKGFINLNNALIELDNPSYKFEDICGKINFSNDSIDWNNLSLKLNEKKFNTDASISISEPYHIKLTLLESDMNFFSSLSLEVDKSGKNFDIEKLIAKFDNSQLELNGST